MLHDMTPGVESHLTSGMCRGYIGFDPTAASLTIGNYVQIMILRLFQQCGHQPIVLMGGATGSIGDPSGKDSERELLSYEVLESNLERQVVQFQKYLDFENGENKALLLNNFDFYKEMNVLDFLRSAGKNLTISYMLSKESVRTRLESGLSFTEFSYQVLQAYDFLVLYRDYHCTVQMGGSDQWGNITSGTEFIRRNTPDGKAYAVTTPLLTKSDGAKFGKSEEGNIWLDPALTSPYAFYQFWINCDDRDIGRFLRYFSLKSRDEILALEEMAEEQPREAKQRLAEELTILIHSPEDYENVLQVSRILFNPKSTPEDVRMLTAEALGLIAHEIPLHKVSKSTLQRGLTIVDLLGESGVCGSKGEARRAVQGNAVSVNRNKVTDIDAVIDHSALLYDTYMLVENGRRNKYILKAV